jgi:uncharacterized membrane protein (UPF0127 family)
MKLRPLSVAFAVTLAAAGLATPGCAASSRPDPRPDAAARLDRAKLTIRTAAGPRAVSVELALSPEAQERGLMFRRALARDSGMLFPFPFPRPASFWMKNTLIPLDLIFIRADGTIARIAANAVPLSLDLIESGEPVAAVLEIAGGEAARRGIAVGDKVRGAGFGA